MKHHFTITFAAVLTTAILCGCSTGAAPAVAEVQAVSSVSQDGMKAAAEQILDIPTTQYFTDEPVGSEDMDAILLAGANAPSAMNGQPWHFSAITDASVIEEISDGMGVGGPPSGMAGKLEGAEPPEDISRIPGNAPGSGDVPVPPAGGGTTKAGIEDAPLVIVVSCREGSAFDAGLACQNMSVEAQLLGYGTKIVSAPAMAINAEGQEALRATLGMPEGYTACALLLVGREDTSVDPSADTYAGATSRNPLEDVATYLLP